jgi:hypothetical protein
MTPLCFREFLVFKNEQNLLSNLANFSNLTQITQNKIQDYLDEFLTWG